MSEQKSKIAFCWQSDSLTGAQQRFLSIASALNKRGCPAIVLLEERHALSLKAVSSGPLPYLVSFQWPWWVRVLGRGRSRFPRWWKALGARRLFHLFSRWHLKRLEKEMGIGLWHVSMSSQFAHSVPGPSVFEVTSPDWADRIVSESDAVPENMPLHAVSDGVYNRLVKKIDAKRVWKAPKLFPNIDPVSAPLPDMEAKDKLIVFAHRLIARKNGLLFARATQEFLSKHPDWTVLIRGEGPEEEAIKKVLAREIENKQVEVGYTGELGSELRRSSIFVSIIKPDNYPSQSVIEAMTFGNALLLSDEGSTREKFFDRNGSMVDIDKSQITNSLIALVSDDNLLRSMGRRSYEIAKERFSQDDYITDLSGLYERLGFSGVVNTNKKIDSNFVKGITDFER